MTFVLALHVAAAIFLIGPLTLASSASAGAIRKGADGVPLLRWLHRSTRVYGLASLMVFALGLVLVRGEFSFNEFWISAAMTLFVVALGLLFGIVERDQRKAIAALARNEPANVQRGRIAAASGVVALMWLAIVLLMFFKPGHHGPA